MTIIKQYVYGLNGTNYPETTTNILGDSFLYATEIGIYGLPGTIFEVNDNGQIILNGSGLLSFGREDFPIKSLKCKNFETLYKDSEGAIKHCLIIDVVGEAN